jgi:hypothetical protein
MDTVSARDPEAGRTLAKTLAEVALCENLLTALFVLIALGMAYPETLFFSPGCHAILLTVLGVALVVAVFFRGVMFLGRVSSIYTPIQGGIADAQRRAT